MAELTMQPKNGANDTATTVPFFIAGKEFPPSKTFDVVSPATGKTVHQSGSASPADALAAVDAAAQAFPAWKKLPPSERRDVLWRAADAMQRRKDELTQYLVDETGGTPDWAAFNIKVAADIIRDVAGRIATIEGAIPALADGNTTGLVLKEPYGVILAIAPWNAPYILGSRAIAVPLAAGNTVVLKGSEACPRVFWAIASCFHEAGLPAGALNMIVHSPADAAAVTTAIIASPHVKKINFTGSTVVGRIIAAQAGQHLKPVLLELGGKAPAIVWEDADLDLAAKQCALGAFLHAGQICMATERILVHKKVAAAFGERFATATRVIFSSGPQAPCLINQAAVDKNRRLLDDAAGKGATVVDTDERELKELGEGARMRPVIVKNVTPEMDIYRTESFGPTVSVIEVETEEEALRIANDTEYGLSSAVFTSDLRRGLRFARGIETGAVHINSMSVHDEPTLPHGGAKSSGYGRFNSIGLDEWVRTKNVTFNN